MTETEWLLSENPDAMLSSRWGPRRERQNVYRRVATSWVTGSTLVDRVARRSAVSRLAKVGMKLTTEDPTMNRRYAALVRCLVPYRRVKLATNETVVALARGIEADGALDRMPILADALEEAGNDDPVLLGHCRNDHHVCGCWVLEALLRSVTSLG